jgi:hypothetical protein
VLAVAITLIAFRWFTPRTIVFPVVVPPWKGRPPRRPPAAVEPRSARRCRTSSGSRSSRSSPSGSRAPAGSTPLRLRVAATTTEPETYLFAKLYARNHVRADRWYKIGRTILYGALEDETPFQSVRRFVEYEDYTLRLLQDDGIPHAEALRRRGDHPGARVHDRDGVLRVAPWSSATRRSTRP